MKKNLKTLGWTTFALFLGKGLVWLGIIYYIKK